MQTNSQQRPFQFDLRTLFVITTGFAVLGCGLAEHPFLAALAIPWMVLADQFCKALSGLKE